jgi:L-asparaginase
MGTFLFKRRNITMTEKKKILLLTTGGTIASMPGGEGLEPHRSDVMERELNQLRTYYDITVRDVMCLDSSNIRPEEWQLIAEEVFRQRIGFDGIVVSHGTDTMAYTASAVTFMLPNIDLPVVFTGSQLPLADMLSDGPENLRTAFAMAATGKPGVFLAFDRKVMLGCRAVKVRASGFSAFESVNARYAGRVSNLGLVLDADVLPKHTGTAELKSAISKNVFLLKLTPGLNPAIFDMLAAMGYKGIVIEAFGLGGFNVLNKGLRGIQRAVEDGISVVVTTQCLYDSADLRVYQVGNKLLDLGVIQGRDMTSEAAMTKLMWAIGQGMNRKQIEALFKRNLAGEITV